MSNRSKFVTALVGLMFMALGLSWQLFLFVVMRDPSGLGTAAGRSHLGLAAAVGVGASIAGVLMFHYFNLHENNKWSKVILTPTGPLLTLNTFNPLNSPARIPFNAQRWALANAWLSDGQAADRLQMDGAVDDSGETSSGQRAFARRTHQLMFKKWSQESHD